MGLLARLVEQRWHPSSGNSALYGAWGAASKSAAGVYVNADSAMSIGAVFACLRLISGTLGAVPLITYRRLKRGKEKAPEYFLYELLHDQPNEEQTALEFREMLEGHLLLRGRAYARIDRAMGLPKRLVPIHPDNTTPDRINGELVYRWFRNGVEPERILRPSRGEIMALSSLGGRSVIECARESFGLALALEEFGAKLYSNGLLQRSVLKHPGALTDAAHNRLKDDFDAKRGLIGAGGSLILESGMEVQELGMTSMDAEFMASRKHQISDVARWFLVPPHMIGDTEKSTSWGTGIEQQSLGFHQHTMNYWYVLWEQVIRRDLIPQEDRQTYFSRFLVEGLLRGDIATRYAAYSIGRQWGWFSANDILELEDRNPLPGDQGDIYISPLNMVPAEDLGKEPKAPKDSDKE